MIDRIILAYFLCLCTAGIGAFLLANRDRELAQAPEDEEEFLLWVILIAIAWPVMIPGQVCSQIKALLEER